MNIDPTAPSDRPETAQMVVIHNALRREVRLLAGLVGSAPSADVQRRRSVAGHAELVLGFLHEHHDSEDRYIWPLLRQRAPLDTALVAAMEAEHAAIDRLVRDARTELSSWAADGEPSHGQRAVACLRELESALTAHLAHEEREVLPLIHEHLTVAEWEATQQAALDDGPPDLRSKLLLAGMVLEDATEAERGWFKSVMPAPARVLWRVAGARFYTRHVAALRSQP